MIRNLWLLRRNSVEKYIDEYKEGDIDIYGNKVLGVYTYVTGDWRWVDEYLYMHLVRCGVELTKGVKAKVVKSSYIDWSFTKKEWSWQDEKGNWHKGDVYE
jgi:hypothetical protein